MFFLHLAYGFWTIQRHEYQYIYRRRKARAIEENRNFQRRQLRESQPSCRFCVLFFDIFFLVQTKAGNSFRINLSMTQWGIAHALRICVFCLHRKSPFFRWFSIFLFHFNFVSNFISQTHCQLDLIVCVLRACACVWSLENIFMIIAYRFLGAHFFGFYFVFFFPCISLECSRTQDFYK